MKIVVNIMILIIIMKIIIEKKGKNLKKVEVMLI